jgi:hypothetical protein
LFALFRGGQQQLVGHYYGRLAAILNDLRYAFGFPRAKAVDNNTSVCMSELRHVYEFLEGRLALLFRFIPVESALL